MNESQTQDSRKGRSHGTVNESLYYSNTFWWYGNCFHLFSNSVYKD